MTDSPGRPWRLTAGLAIVALWLGGLALLGRRELLRPMSERLAEAALQVHPASHYYIFERDGRIVGGGSAEVDTTGYGIVFRQHLFGQLLEGDTGSIVLRSRSSYTPTLLFGGFRIEVQRATEQIVLAGQRTEDSLLTVTLGGPNESPHTQQTIARDPLFLPATAALPLVLLSRPRVGASRDVTVFDPLRQRARSVPLRITGESLLVVVDSAAFDAALRQWTPARSDTLRAWLVASDSSPVRAWIDRSGAVVQASDGRGTTAVRTAYEIAYENWRLGRAGEAP